MVRIHTTHNYKDNHPTSDIRPHAVKGVENTSGRVHTDDNHVTYNDLGKASCIVESHAGIRYDIVYGPDGERWESSLYKTSYQWPDTVRRYVGDMEIVSSGPSEVCRFYYLGHGVVLRKVNNTVTPLYAFTDNLGSVTRLYTETGVEKFRAQYDPWGVQVVNRNDVNFTRGYCGHEMLNDFQLINMNGRMYDPVLGRFLSPDNYVQMPTSAQGFNRYSYCLNNPLKYIDPDGEFVFSLFLGPVGAVIDAACWGAVIGGASYTVSVAISHGGFNNWNWGQFGKSLGFGAISGAVSFGIGEGFQALGNIAGNIGTPIIQGITHGIASGSISVLEGGNFLQGLVSGTFSSWAGSGYDAIGFGGQLGTTSMLGFGALSGGIGSWVSGGNFLHGVAIGALTSGLNHLQHKTEEYKFFHRLRRHYNKGTGEDFNIKPDEFKYLIKKGDIDFTNAKDIGDGYYSATINFYNSSNDLALSFGRATVIYKKYNGRNVYKHFYDRYDFDAKHWGVRSFLNEIITRSYGKLYGGKAFDIYYNKLWRK